MPITITDSDNISTIHSAERLEINLLVANEDVQKMAVKVYFVVDTQLSNGKAVAPQYLDLSNPLLLTCENDPELAEAMQVIQQKIGQGRYLQITAPPEIPEPVESPEMMPPTENS